jgi:hypothetical protein
MSLKPSTGPPDPPLQEAPDQQTFKNRMNNASAPHSKGSDILKKIVPGLVVNDVPLAKCDHPPEDGTPRKPCASASATPAPSPTLLLPDLPDLDDAGPSLPPALLTPGLASILPKIDIPGLGPKLPAIQTSLPGLLKKLNLPPVGIPDFGSKVRRERGGLGEEEGTREGAKEKRAWIERREDEREKTSSNIFV